MNTFPEVEQCPTPILPQFKGYDPRYKAQGSESPFSTGLRYSTRAGDAILEDGCILTLAHLN